MQMNKFEEKTAEFLKEIYGEVTKFTVEVISEYKGKYLTFNCVRGLDVIAFKLADESLDNLFDKAFRVVKSFGPKATRERSKEDTASETTGEGE